MNNREELNRELFAEIIAATPEAIQEALDMLKQMKEKSA